MYYSSEDFEKSYMLPDITPIAQALDSDELFLRTLDGITTTGQYPDLDIETLTTIKDIGIKLGEVMKNQMKQDLAQCKEIADVERLLGEIGMPAKKLYHFLVKDILDQLEYLRTMQWLKDALSPDNKKRQDKWDSLRKARDRERIRLTKAYYRYLPMLNQKMKNRLSALESQSNLPSDVEESQNP